MDDEQALLIPDEQAREQRIILFEGDNLAAAISPSDEIYMRNSIR